MSESPAVRVRKYIDAHLKEPITARELARAAGYSQFHMTRLFKHEMGITPFEYIRQQRLLKSAHALRQGKRPVIDVAFDYAFDTQEGFTRAFSNAFGISPKRYSAFSAPEGWMIPYYYLDRKKLQVEAETMENRTTVIFTQIVERPARKLILFRSRNSDEYHSYCEEVGCGSPERPAPWDVLCGIQEAINEPIGVWLPESMRIVPTGIYAHAVEVPADYSGEIPQGFDVIDLEPCKYLIFQGEPYDDSIYCEAVGSCMREIEKFNPTVYGYEYDEAIAPRFQFAPAGWRGYIEGRAIRPAQQHL